MNNRRWDGIGPCRKPENKVPLLFVEGANNSIPLAHRRTDAVRTQESPGRQFLSYSSDPVSTQFKSLLENEKVPCSEPLGSVMASQHDHRGGGPDEPTNNDAKNSCHRSHVGALIGWGELSYPASKVSSDIMTSVEPSFLLWGHLSASEKSFGSGLEWNDLNMAWSMPDIHVPGYRFLNHVLASL